MFVDVQIATVSQHTQAPQQYEMQLTGCQPFL